MNEITYKDYTFTDSNILSGNVHLAASLLSSSLEPNTIDFEVESDDTSLTEYLRNDPLVYLRDGAQVGRFYLQNVERVGPSCYRFTATSAIGLLMEGQHYGGIYTGQTVEEVLPGIMGSVPYYVKSNLKPIKLYGWLPVAAPRDNLSQVLFAIGATVKTDLDGYLRIEGLWDSVSSSIGKDRIYSGAKVSYTPAVTQVVVTEHQYVAGNDSVSLFEGTTAANDIVTFSEPMHSLTATGFQILESGANYARLSAGSGVLKGLKYVHNTRQITKDVAKAQTPNVREVRDATLISLVNSQATAERLANYYKWLETVDAPVIYTGEMPGDRVEIYHPYDNTDTTACLQSADITLSGVLKAQEKVLAGYVPPMTEDVVTYENKTILTGRGTWTIPTGTKTIRAVLIGGGTGGQAGYDGEAGADTKTVVADNTSHLVYDVGGKGGNGGNGGAGGTGGSVLIIDVTIPDNVRSLTYTCGAAGKGGILNGAEGTAGGSTQMQVGQSSYRSTDGANSGAGYVDVETGDSYGVFGTFGQPGGKGGDGGTWTTSKNPDLPQNENGYEANGHDGESAGLVNSGGLGGQRKVNMGGAQPSGGGNAWADVICGGGGGGAAVSNNGANAVNEHDGGKGANATLTSSKVSYGSGGIGGNGGGGGGGGGGVLSMTYSGWESPLGHTAEGNKGALGGTGSSGGDGGAGCIIIYYGVPHVTSSGWLVDKNGKYILDKYSRRIVV